MFNMFYKMVNNTLDVIERIQNLSTYERDYEDYEDDEDEIVTSCIDSKGYHVDYTRRK